MISECFLLYGCQQDIIVYCFSQILDIPKSLKDLRQQRMHLVQVVGQYKFVYSAIIHYIRRARLI